MLPVAMSQLPRAIYDGTASCATCVLWRPETESATPGDMISRGVTVGTCRAEPPKSSSMAVFSSWPCTRPNDFCGKFSPAGERELATRRQGRPAPDSPAAAAAAVDAEDTDAAQPAGPVDGSDDTTEGW